MSSSATAYWRRGSKARSSSRIRWTGTTSATSTSSTSNTRPTCSRSSSPEASGPTEDSERNVRHVGHDRMHPCRGQARDLGLLIDRPGVHGDAELPRLLHDGGGCLWTERAVERMDRTVPAGS